MAPLKSWKIQLFQRSKQKTCVYCREELGEAPSSCADCGTALHPECVRELDSCPSLGCEGLSGTDEGQTGEERVQGSISNDTSWRFQGYRLGVSRVEDLADESRLTFVPDGAAKFRGLTTLQISLAILALALLFKLVSFVFVALIIILAASGLLVLRAAKKAERRKQPVLVSIQAFRDRWILVTAFEGEPNQIRIHSHLKRGAILFQRRGELIALTIDGEDFFLPPLREEDAPGFVQELRRAWREGGAAS